MKGHKGHHHGKHREAGGRAPAHVHESHAGGEPEVFEEAEGKRRKHGGSIHAARAKHHLGKRGRRHGGRVGADKSPLSSAHHGSGGHEAHKHGGKVHHRD